MCSLHVRDLSKVNCSRCNIVSLSGMAMCGDFQDLAESGEQTRSTPTQPTLRPSGQHFVTRNGLLVATILPESKRNDYIPPRGCFIGPSATFPSYGQYSEARYSPKIIYHHDVALLPLSSHVEHRSAVR
jgi:hypothetical protein